MHVDDSIIGITGPWPRANEYYWKTVPSIQICSTTGYARRVALGRPERKDTREMLLRIAELEAVGSPTAAQQAELERLLLSRELAERRRSKIPFIDTFDVRYKFFTPRPERAANAVMFCLMDVSASMGEREKGLTKRKITRYLLRGRHT